MRRWIILLLFFCIMFQPVSALDLSAPTAPESAQKYMPQEQESFAQGLWYIIKTAIASAAPQFTAASKICMRVIIVVLLASILCTLSEKSAACVRLTGVVIIGILLLEPTGSLLQLGTETINELSAYAKLLLPVMTTAVAAQGGVTTSAALFTGTMFFNALLTTIISRLIVPAMYIYLCLCVAGSALANETLKKIRDFVKWAMTWCLKLTLYCFTGYISITGVISGAVDASTLKAAKLTISGVVPVIGGILSDASETILVSAGMMKSTAGVYGIFAVIAVCIGPFLQIGVQYLLLKLSGAVCHMFGYKPAVDLVDDFSTGMGLTLAMTGTVCMLILISLVCFMNGMK